MNRLIQTIFFTLIIGTLFACTPGSEIDVGGVVGEGVTSLSGDLPQAGALAVGTLQLENGSNGVTEEQAAVLLPLWQAYNGLAADQATAEAELDALINQISSEMTAPQLAEIEGLELTQAKLQEMIANGEIQLGPGRFGNAGQQGGDQNGNQGNGQAGGGRQGGGPGGGGPPGGGQGGGPGVGGLSEDDIATRRAERAEAAGGEDAFLVQSVGRAVVNLLNVKVNGEEGLAEGRGNRFGFINQTVATELGLELEDVQTELQNGKTLLDLIEENGGDLDSILTAINEAVAGTQMAEQDNLDELIDGILAGEQPGRGQ